MKKMRNRIKLMAACAALSIACIGAGVLNYSGASAVAENSEEFLVAGASVKYVHDVAAIEDQDGLRFAVVVKNDVFESWLNATQTGFAEGVSVGALVLPKDLAMGEELTHSTEVKQVENQAGILDREFAFADFMDSYYEDYSGYKMAFVYLYDIPVDSYNREYMVSAYQMQDDEMVYTETISRSIAWVADKAIADGDANADKLNGYIREYAVNFYINGEESSEQSIFYGGTIDTAKLPTVPASKVTWYADESFETPFEFTQKVTGTTNVYGKSVTRASLTDGVFSYVDNDYEVSGSGVDLTLTQALMNSSKKLGLAKFGVDGTADYSVSAKITLSTPGTESWITDESNTRVGLAFYGEGEGANSYIYSYRAGNTVFIRNTNGANELYNDTTDDGRKSFWDVRRDYLSDGTTEFTMKVEKIGTAISVYVNDKLLETLTVAEGANLVPAIFSYTFENKDNVVTVTYSNIIVDACDSECSVCGLCTDGECLAPDHANKCVTALGLFGTHTAGYVATKDENGNWSVAQKLEKVTAEKGYAVLSNMPEDYYVSVDLKLTQRIKVTSQGWEASENDQYGFAFIDETAGENYRFLMRSVMAAVAKFEKSTTLFGGEGDSYFLYGKNNGVGSEMTPFIHLQNTANINDNLTVNLAMNKDGNVITFYVNGEAVLSTVVEDGFTGVPALLAYSLEDEPKQTITYTNITVSEAIRGTRKVTYYINGEQSGEPIEVAYGATIDVATVPTMEQGELTWYADETFETAFDFEQEITADTNVYGKFVSILEQTGIFSSMEKTYSWTKEDGTLTVTQNLQVSSNRGGMATMSLENNDSFYVSTSISLKNSINIAKDGNWRDGGNERIGFAFINEETGEGYRFMMRTMWASVTTYGKATNLYADENGTSVYLYGKTNSMPYTPYIKLNNTNNLNEVYSITLGLAKVDNTLFFYVNGELIACQEVEDGFTGVPALLGYSYYAQTTQVLTFTNITVTEPTLPEYSVSFNVGGTEVSKIAVAHGETITNVPTSEAGTYEWFADEACETPFDFEQAITGATTVYGVFTLNEYTVSVYVNGNLNIDLALSHGDKIDMAQLPTMGQGELTWYADETFETAFDFEQEITADTNVYGKFVSILEQTGIFSSMEKTYSWTKEDGTLTVTQNLQVSSNRGGMATMSLENNDSFYVSTSISLKNSINIAKDGNWRDGGNERIGFAFINEETGEGYRFMMRTMWASVTTYGKATNLYADENGTSVYLYGKTNSMPYTPYIKLNNTNNLNEVYSITLGLAKVDNTLFFYVNGELIACQEVEDGFTGVPALLGYSYYAQTTQVLTFTNITVTEPTLPEYSVSFNVGGTEVSKIAVAHGETIDEATIPTSVAGAYEWFADEACETPFDFDQAIKGATTVYGVFTPNVYTVTIYVNGAEEYSESVSHGDKFNAESLPNMGDGKHTWYADAEFTTEFDFGQSITGDTAIYGKYETIADLTGGLMESLDDNYAISGSGESLTLTQTLGSDKGLAYFNVGANDDYTLSVDIKLSNNPATAAQAANQGVDMRVGFALIDTATGENYRFLFRGTKCALIYYDKSTELYEYRSGSGFEESQGAVTYVYGKTNSTPNSPMLVLQNTGAINNNANITLSMTKVGNTVSIYLNGEFWMTVETEEGFTGVPALLSYELDGKGGRKHVYSNINLDVCEAACGKCGYCADGECELHNEKCVATLEAFGAHTSDYKAVKDANGNWTVSQALGNGTDGKGVAYFNVGETDSYSISVDVQLAGNPATAAQGVNDGADIRMGFALINPETNENYRFLFRGTQAALIYYDKSTELYEVRSGSAFEETTVGAVTYVYGSTNSTPKEPKLVLQNTNAINGSKNINLTLMKAGNTVAVLINGELWTTVEMADGFAGVPAFLSYSLDGKTRTHTYSNVAIKEMAYCDVCGLCEETECVIHNEKCIATLGYFGNHTAGYKAVKSNGNWTASQTLGNGTDGKGLAYFNVGEAEDYSISVDIKLSGNPATAAQGATVGADMRVGFALINPETGENYRFLFRGTQCALIYYDKSTELYELRSGSAFAETTVGQVTYVYGKTNSTPKSPMLVLQNTSAINGTTNITLKLEKVGNALTVYLNGELWNTFTVEEGFVGVPALLSYELDGKGGRTHTYSNVVITTGAENA